MEFLNWLDTQSGERLICGGVFICVIFSHIFPIVVVKNNYYWKDSKNKKDEKKL